MTTRATAAPPLLAYTDRPSARPGESLSLMVSAIPDVYEVDVVRLIHGAERGPGPRSLPVASLGAQAGAIQSISSGSYLRVPADRRLTREVFTACAWIYPTCADSRSRQAILSADSWSLGIESGRLALWSDGGSDPVVSTARPLRSHEWCCVTASFDPDGNVTIAQLPKDDWPSDSRQASATTRLSGFDGNRGDILVAAVATDADHPSAHFNGRIDRPALYDGVPAEQTIDAVAALELIACWDAGAAESDTVIPDVGPYGVHATAVNFPARGIPGHNWSGREIDFRQAPREFGALHYHDDDLTDAGWQPSLTYTIPDDLPSGVYAFRLTAGTSELMVAFYVAPVLSAAPASVAVLIPTMTYLAYANVHAGHRTGERLDSPAMTDEHRWAAQHGLRSLYDVHSDGSGTYYASYHRPLTTIVPDHIDPLTGTLWNLSADLCLIDWLEHEQIGYDVITDHLLHDEGAALLARYTTVVSGTHPEYYTEPMLNAHEEYVSSGGRYMYLGGNGYYWVTGLSDDDPSVAEIRRGHTGERTWEAAPGECFLSTTGEMGGLWRHRGRAPQRHVGVGFTSQGTSASGRPYTISAEARHDPRVAFILEGVGDTVDGNGLIAGNPAGSEIDRADRSLGTPEHAVVVGTADHFSEEFTLAVEDVHGSSGMLGPADPLVRSDLVFFETRDGGAVFSTGSIAWSTALADQDYASPVARLTGNVLRRFLDPAPF